MPISVNNLVLRTAREGRRRRNTRITVAGLLKDAAGMSSIMPITKQAASRQFHLIKKDRRGNDQGSRTLGNTANERQPLPSLLALSFIFIHG